MPSFSHIAFYGTIIHSLSLTELDIITQGVLVVDSTNGVIVHLERNVQDVDAFLIEQHLESCQVSRPLLLNYLSFHFLLIMIFQLHRLKEHEFLLPGFVDTHAVSAYFLLTWET